MASAHVALSIVLRPLGRIAQGLVSGGKQLEFLGGFRLVAGHEVRMISLGEYMVSRSNDRLIGVSRDA